MSTLKIKDDTGKEHQLDLTALHVRSVGGEHLSSEQLSALNKLSEHGSVEKLAPADKETLKNVVAKIGGGMIPELADAIIVRFDANWVSIN